MSTIPKSKILVLETEHAEIVLDLIKRTKASDYAPAQRKRLPSLLRALGRYCIADAEELHEEKVQCQQEDKQERKNLPNQERRKRGRPPLATR
jgi:hypothetical protein